MARCDGLGGCRAQKGWLRLWLGLKGCRSAEGRRHASCRKSRVCPRRWLIIVVVDVHGVGRTGTDAAAGRRRGTADATAGSCGSSATSNTTAWSCGTGTASNAASTWRLSRAQSCPRTYAAAIADPTPSRIAPAGAEACRLEALLGVGLPPCLGFSSRRRQRAKRWPRLELLLRRRWLARKPRGGRERARRGRRRGGAR